MKRLLIHLGYPKTATTTLQHHLFPGLDTLGYINYLGKQLKLDEKIGGHVELNARGRVIRDYCDAVTNDLVGSRSILNEITQDGIVNLYSDEGFLVYYPGKVNIPYDKKIKRLKQLTEGYDVCLLISLRNPVDLIYSLYVELYRDYYRFDKKLDSFSKYIRLYADQPELNGFKAFDMFYVLNESLSSFKTHVNYYEDLKSDLLNYCSSLSEFLGVETHEICNLIDGKEENVKKTIGSSKEVSLNFQDYFIYILPFLRRFPMIYKILKLFYNNSFLSIKRFFFISIPIAKKHSYPNLEESRAIKVLCCSSKLRGLGYLNLDKLTRYGYLDESND